MQIENTGDDLMPTLRAINHEYSQSGLEIPMTIS